MEGSSFFSFSLKRSIILCLKGQCKFYKVLSSEFCHFYSREVDKGRKRRELEPTAEFHMLCCLSLTKLIADMRLWKRSARRIRILLEHFRIILKWDLYWYLRWKLMLILLAAVMWGNVQCWAHYPPTQN